MSTRAGKSTGSPGWHNFFHLLFPFVSGILPYTQTTSSFILGFDGVNPFLMHVPCFAVARNVNLKWVDAIVAKNLLFVYRERISETKGKSKWKKLSRPVTCTLASACS